MFNYKMQAEGNGVIIYFEGDFDIDVTEVIEDEILPSLGEYQQVSFDLAKVPFVDSSGIGLLINMVNVLKQQEIKVFITNTQQDVKDIFAILQLPEIIGEEVFV
jgi:anti-anti-sigma factor